MRLVLALAGLALVPARATRAEGCRPGTAADLGRVADPAVVRAIQLAAGAVHATEAGESIRPVTCDELLALRAIDVRATVTSLRGIGVLAHLERLSVGERFDYYRVDFQPRPLPAAALAGLAELPALRALSLGPVADLGPVAGLGALEELNVDRVVSPDLTPLAALHHLRVLQIGAGDPAVWKGNANPAERRAGLVYALERGGEVADLRPLAGLTALEVVEIPGARVADLTPFGGLRALRVLNLRHNAVVDLAPLAALTRLEVLFLERNRIADAGPLAGLTALREVRLGENPIVDAAPFAGLGALRELFLERTLIQDARPFAGLTNLKQLYLCDSPANKAARGNRAARANQAVFRVLRKRGTSVPNQFGCHCC